MMITPSVFLIKIESFAPLNIHISTFTAIVMPRNSGRNGPNVILRPAHPKFNIFKINWTAQQALLAEARPRWIKFEPNVDSAKRHPIFD